MTNILVEKYSKFGVIQLFKQIENRLELKEKRIKEVAIFPEWRAEDCTVKIV